AGVVCGGAGCAVVGTVVVAVVVVVAGAVVVVVATVSEVAGVVVAGAGAAVVVARVSVAVVVTVAGASSRRSRDYGFRGCRGRSCRGRGYRGRGVGFPLDRAIARHRRARAERGAVAIIVAGDHRRTIRAMTLRSLYR